MKTSTVKVRTFSGILFGLLLAATWSAKAAPVALDSMAVNNVSVTLAITGVGTYSFADTIAPPVDLLMGVYQDPIASGSIWKIYTTGVYGQPAPSGTVDAALGTINVNLSSLRGQFTIGRLGSYDLSLWPLTTPPSSGTYFGTTDAYTLSWSKPFSLTLTGGPIPLTVGGNLTVNLAGTATPVPAPAALWLLGSGLLGLAGVARRRGRAAQVR